MAGVSKCMKYSMFLFNFIFWVCGCVILGVSIWLRVSAENKQQLATQESYVFSAIDVMIAAGAIIMVLGFLGCCGAVKESPCLLLLFFIGLLLILALQVTAGTLVAVYKPQSEEKVKEMLQKVLPLNTKPDFTQQIVEIIQQENKCCGIVNGASDWGNRPPESCSCSSPSKCRNGYYEQTCTSLFIEAATKPHLIIIGIAFGLLLVELCGLGLSMTLYCQMKKK